MLKAAFIFIYLKMQIITGSPRNPMVFMRLEENVDLNAFGFELQTLKTDGRSRFNPQVFLKIYL